ncbi:MAG: cyclodeaminase/cyclohydrolase family protein [Acidobacteria bacterium]|nr:cyclodeaminase/cyclohydrolase family protein [Acidobacteriota bacterium]MDW7983955.1 cyclodeaminase/cyclohydrolase family protein [Acidobacteriota bacterium]
MAWVDRSVRDFIEAVAAATPTPGGGSIAALAAASAAALLQMYVLRSAQSSRVAPDWRTRFPEVAGRIAGWKLRALALVDEDVRTFEAVLEARRQSQTTEAERAARAEAIRTATLRAAGVPLEVAELCLQALQACQELVPHGLASMRSDVQTAYYIARAGLAAALANVAINLEVLEPAAVPEDLRARYEAACQALAVAPPDLRGYERAGHEPR